MIPWLLFVHAALAEPGVPPFQLSWKAAAACPDGADVEHRIETELVGQATPAQTVVASGVVAEEGSAFRLRLDIATAGGHATDVLRDADCERLAEAAALKIALAVESAAAAEKADALTSVAAEPTDDERPLSAPPPSPSSPLVAVPTVQLRVAAGVDWGSLPGVGIVVDAGVGLIRWPRWRLEIGVIYAPPRRFWQIDDPAFGGELAAVGGVVRGGPMLGRGPLRCALEGAVELTAVLARPLDGMGDQTVFRAALWLMPSLVWQQRRLSLWVSPGLGVPVSRYRFVTGSGVDYRAKPVALRGSLGVGVAL